MERIKRSIADAKLEARLQLMSALRSGEDVAAVDMVARAKSLDLSRVTGAYYPPSCKHNK